MTNDAPKPDPLATLERGLGAVRIRDGLSKASRIFPKSRSVIFVARECGGDSRFDYFGDNIKYAFLGFQKQAEALRASCWFLTDSERVHKDITSAGLPCLPWFLPHWTSEHMKILLAAKVAVLNNIFYPASERGYLPYALLQGAKMVQMWHGIPLKAIGMEALLPPMACTPRAAEVLGASGPFDIFLGTSRATEDDWARRFAFADYAPGGYPRTDVMFREPTPHDLINVDARVLEKARQLTQSRKPFVLYAPTFRDGEFGVWFERAKIEALADHCEAKGYGFAVALHPFECGFIQNYRQRYPRVNFVEPLTDIYPVLGNTGVLITDYSSIAFDFLMLDRPIVFYRPDHNDYIAKSRPLIPENEEYLCGPVVNDIESLIGAVNAAAAASMASIADQDHESRDRLRQKLYDHIDGEAAERLNAVLLGLLDTA